MPARVFGASTIGVDARVIDVETNFHNGLPKFFLVSGVDVKIPHSF